VARITRSTWAEIGGTVSIMGSEIFASWPVTFAQILKIPITKS
jgi:hypothetical protein